MAGAHVGRSWLSGGSDRASVQVEIGLARPMRDADRIAALFARGLEAVDAGFGIDALRLHAPLVEPLAPAQLTAGSAPARSGDALADLLSRLSNRIGFDRVQWLLPADSLIPERGFTVAPAVYSEPVAPVPLGDPLRPITIFPPKPVAAVSGQAGEPSRPQSRHAGDVGSQGETQKQVS